MKDFNTFVASGILTSAGYCAVLLGAQFSFTAGLWKLAQGQNAQARQLSIVLARR